MTATTFGQVLAERLRSHPGRPLVTFYDDLTGERTELSVTTYANWVAKTAGVLVDDLGLARGDRVLVDLPTHWLGPVFLGASWLAGLEVVGSPGERGGAVDLVVHGPSGPVLPGVQHLGCALLPFAVPAREQVWADTLDFATLWPGQPDAFLGEPASAGDTALDGIDQATLLERARRGEYADAPRVLTDLNPVTPAGTEIFLGALVSGGSVVLLGRPDPGSWAGRAGSERVTREVRDPAATPPHPPRS